MKQIIILIVTALIASFSNAQVIHDESYLDIEFMKFKAEMTIAKVKGQWKIISFYHGPGC